MKLAALTALVSLALASPILERETPQCTVHGVRGAIPTQIEQSAFKRIPGIKSTDQCNAECKLPANKQCKAFTVRTTGNGACLLYSAAVSFRPDPTASVVIYNLPEGVRGGTPHNNPAWYNPDTTKTRGNYAGCREHCLNDQRCKGFGYKDGGNCRLFDVSLAGRVSPDPEFPYIHYQNDCTFVAPA